MLIARRISGSPAKPSCWISSSARSVMRSNCRLTSAASTSFERNACVQTLSTRMSASSRPSAEKTPGYCGTITFGMPSERATAAACSGPAPPKASSEKRRGSWPRSSETILIALAMFSFAISTIDAASSSGPSPIGSPSASIASWIGEASSCMRPARK